MIASTDDFNAQLLLLLCESDNNIDNEKQTCLISGEDLQDDHITLKCNHKFNYVPLVNELINQKQYTQLEIINLKQYEVKCPYCRSIQQGVIPYNEKYNIDKISGVNWPPSKLYKGNTCSAILKSGKRKGLKCSKACSGVYCSRHIPKVNITKKVYVCCGVQLKSGKRKGELCGSRCTDDEGIKHKMCKRHLKYKKAKINHISQENIIISI
jgi:hypothetical protein